MDEQLHKILDSVDNLTGPIKSLIAQAESGRSVEEFKVEEYSPLDRGVESVEFAGVVAKRIMGTPRSESSNSPGSMEALLAEQGYITPENQKVDSDYSPATSEASETRSEISTRTDDSPKIPVDIENAMRKKEMERFMKRVALKHKAMSPETRERIEKNRRNSVLGTGVTPRKDVGKSTKDFMGSKNKYNTPGGGSGAAFASSKRPDLFKVDVADGGHNRHGRRGSIMDVLDPGGKSKKGARGKIRRKSCIDMSHEAANKEKKKDAAKDKGWSLDGKTPPPNRRASISVFKPLSQ